MGEQRANERDSVKGTAVHEARPFPIGIAGWLGIAAAILGIAYFLVPDDTPERASDRKPLSGAQSEGPQTSVNRYEIVDPTAGRGTPADARGAAAKQEPAEKPKAGAVQSDGPRSQR